VRASIIAAVLSEQNRPEGMHEDTARLCPRCGRGPESDSTQVFACLRHPSRRGAMSNLRRTNRDSHASHPLWQGLLESSRAKLLLDGAVGRGRNNWRHFPPDLRGSSTCARTLSRCGLFDLQGGRPTQVAGDRFHPWPHRSKINCRCFFATRASDFACWRG